MEYIKKIKIEQPGTSGEFLEYGIMDQGAARSENATLTGIPTAPTPENANNTDQIATTKFVNSVLSVARQEISGEIGDSYSLITNSEIDKIFEDLKQNN